MIDLYVTAYGVINDELQYTNQK